MTDTTKDAPLSCGDAWIKFSHDEDLFSERGNWMDDMQAAFEGGWDAAFAAFMKDSPDVR